MLVWNPCNDTNNAIMSGVVYFRYNTTWTYGCTMKVLINDVTVANSGVYKYSAGYEQSLIYNLNTVNSILPNQNSYTIKFQISSGYVDTWIASKLETLHFFVLRTIFYRIIPFPLISLRASNTLVLVQRSKNAVSPLTLV